MLVLVGANLRIQLSGKYYKSLIKHIFIRILLIR